MLLNTKGVKHVGYESSDDFDQEQGTASLGDMDNNKEVRDVNSVGVDTEKNANSVWSIYLYSNGTNVEYKIDPGAQANILPKKVFNKLKVKPMLKTRKVKLTGYNG